jgi:hypothetical protein
MIFRAEDAQLFFVTKTRFSLTQLNLNGRRDSLLRPSSDQAHRGVAPLERRRKSTTPHPRGGINEDAATNVPTNGLPELPYIEERVKVLALIVAGLRGSENRNATKVVTGAFALLSSGNEASSCGD